MKYILAILACAGLFMLYAILGREVFGWKHGGGAIPVFILLAFVAATWRAITKKEGYEPEEEEGDE